MRYTPLWQQSGTYPAALDRLLIASLFEPVSQVAGMVVTTVTNTMDVQVAAGKALVMLQAGQGAVLCVSDAPETVTLPQLVTGGQSRIDLIIAQVRDNDLDTGGNNDWVITSVQGVPAASNPVVPAVPPNAVAIEQVTVVGGAANLNGATLVDRRVACGLGGVIPFGRLQQATNFAAQTNGNFTGVSVVNELRGGMRHNGIGSLIVPVGGVYHCAARWNSANASTSGGTLAECGIDINRGLSGATQTAKGRGVAAPAGTWPGAVVATDVVLAAGATVGWSYYQNAGGINIAGDVGTTLTVHYVGGPAASAGAVEVLPELERPVQAPELGGEE